MSLYSSSEVRPVGVESYRCPHAYRGPQNAYTGETRAKRKAAHREPARTGPKDPYRTNQDDPYNLRERMGLKERS
jgi:hypothetical protein